jgi:hypothetical protein
MLDIFTRYCVLLRFLRTYVFRVFIFFCYWFCVHPNTSPAFCLVCACLRLFGAPAGSFSAALLATSCTCQHLRYALYRLPFLVADFFAASFSCSVSRLYMLGSFYQWRGGEESCPYFLPD